MTVDRTPVAGIVLAAGLSRRFGGNKLLADFRGRPIIRRVVEAALASRLERVVVVLGHEHAKVRAALIDDDRLQLVVNHAYGDGQSGSVIAGLKAVRAPAAMFLMGDQPLLDTAIIDALIAAFHRAGKDICYPCHAGSRRGPVIFSRRFYPDILSLTGDTGARALIDANADAAIAVAFAEGRPFEDVDRDVDLARLNEEDG